jgi:hypothetical protein
VGMAPNSNVLLGTISPSGSFLDTNSRWLAPTKGNLHLSAPCKHGKLGRRKGKVLRGITCIEDLRLLARRRVPRMFYDYVDSGSWTESTYRANERELAAIAFGSVWP